MNKDFQSLQGQFLLDGGKLQGSFFGKSVVLICQHDPEGAFGLMLNRQTGKKVQDAIESVLPEGLQKLDVFLGGPVQPSALTFLHTDSFLLNANVMPNLSMGHSLEDLIELGDSYSPSQQVRVFAGYSGWSAGQLEGEMASDSWITHKADVDLVFNTAPQELWKTILRQKGPQYRLLIDAPEDLSWN